MNVNTFDIIGILIVLIGVIIIIPKRTSMPSVAYSQSRFKKHHNNRFEAGAYILLGLALIILG